MESDLCPADNRDRQQVGRMGLVLGFVASRSQEDSARETGSRAEVDRHRPLRRHGSRGFAHMLVVAPRRIQRVLAAACLIGLLAPAGCGSMTWFKNGFLDPTQIGVFDKPARNEIVKAIGILEEPQGLENAVEPNEQDLVVDYTEPTISEGDVIQIAVTDLLQIGDTTGLQVPVSNSGFATLTGIGRMKVAGFTAPELEEEIKRKLVEDGIMVEAPEVQVLLLSAQAQSFSVVGFVSRPGQFAISRPDFRLLDAVASIGGIPDQIDRIYIFRKGAGAAAGAATAPATDTMTPAPAPATMPEFEPISFTMSDFSSGPSGGMQDTPPPTSQPPEEMFPMDELDQIDRTPTGPAPQPYFDEATQSWREGPPPPTSEPASDIMPDHPVQPDRVPVAPPSPPFEPEPAGQGPDLTPPVRILEIPVKELMAGDMRYNVVIRPADLIKVEPDALGQYYMMGHVARPGAYGFNGRPLTVKEAIASAGGFDILAWPARADLTRRVSQYEAQTIQLDLDAVFAGNAPDVYLRPNDILNVGTHPIASFLAVLRNSFRMSYGLGFVYDRNYADEDTFFAKEAQKNRRTAERQARGLPF